MSKLNIQYNLPTDSINKVNRWYTARKAAGLEVQPWELEQAWKGEFAKQGEKESRDMQFGMALERGVRQQDAERSEKGRQFDITQAEKARQFGLTLGEKARQFDTNLTEDERRLQEYIKAGKRARRDAEEMGKWQLGANALTTILGSLNKK